jgi:DNA-binding winged helix-turn-helix (wHTH) protein
MLRFADFTFDPSTGELRRGGGPVIPLEPQPARVLAVLASRPGSLVTRDELCAAVWPEGTHVEFDQGLNYCIRQVRAALGDDARHPLFVQTAARRGYRFLASVQVVVPIRHRRISKLAVVAVGVVAVFWIAEWLEGPGDGAAHHQAAMAMLQTLHDLIY